MSDIYEEIIKGGNTYHSFEVTKNTKGYGWSVKVAGGNKDEAFDTLIEVEAKLKSKFGTPEKLDKESKKS